MALRDLWDRSHSDFWGTYGTSWNFSFQLETWGPMYGSGRPMGPVPCIAAKDLWDRSHAWLLDKHGTGPIGQLGLHIMTWFRSVFPIFFKAYIYNYAQLARIKREIPKNSKNHRETKKFKIELGDHKNPLSSQKCPPFVQFSIFWALVFCKHPTFDSTKWFCIKNMGL